LELVCITWNKVLSYFPNKIKKLNVKRSAVELVVLPSNLPGVLKFLKFSSTFKMGMLIDIVAIDFLKVRRLRFYLIYSLLNVKTGLRVNVHTAIGSQKKQINTITAIFVNANWIEREIFDLFGIYFYKHPRLSKILSDYSLIGHPMLKDYPLAGYADGRAIHFKGVSNWVLRSNIVADIDS